MARSSTSINRAQCWLASYNLCVKSGWQYAEGGGQCHAAYYDGGGSCNAETFREKYNDKLTDLCRTVSAGIAFELP